MRNFSGKNLSKHAENTYIYSGNIHESMTNRESNALEISIAASDTRGQRAHWPGNIRKNLPVILQKGVVVCDTQDTVVDFLKDHDTKLSEASMNLTQHRVGMIPGPVIVGNACFILAKLAGCNPITFVGNDLSMPDKEMALKADRVFEGKDPDGNTVYSVQGYLAGLDWLLRYLRADPDCVRKRARVYNSTEGGIMYSDRNRGDAPAEIRGEISRREG